MVVVLGTAASANLLWEADVRLVARRYLAETLKYSAMIKKREDVIAFGQLARVFQLNADPKICFSCAFNNAARGRLVCSY